MNKPSQMSAEQLADYKAACKAAAERRAREDAIDRGNHPDAYQTSEERRRARSIELFGHPGAHIPDDAF
jgi:hypothetical protein